MTRRTHSTMMPRDGRSVRRYSHAISGPRDADEPPPWHEQRDRLDHRADPLISATGVHRERTTDGTRDSHRELEPGQAGLEGVLNDGPENDAGACPQLLTFDRVPLEALAEHQDRTVVADVRDEARCCPCRGSSTRRPPRPGSVVAHARSAIVSSSRKSAAGPPIRYVVCRVIDSRSRTTPLIDCLRRMAASPTLTTSRRSLSVRSAPERARGPQWSRRRRPSSGRDLRRGSAMRGT